MYTVAKIDGWWWVIEPNSGERGVSESLYESDARRIAHTLNHHDALMDALERTLGDLEQLKTTLFNDTIADARAVLAAAKGEPNAD